MTEDQTDMFDQDDVLERIEIERILRETQALEAQRRAENRAFQEELRTQLGRPAADATPSGSVQSEAEQTAQATPKAKGGARPGAGRKPKSPVAASKVVRIPEQYEAAVRALIAHLDETAKLGRHYGPETSEPMFLRSLYGKAQYLTFTITPLKP